MSVEKGAKLNRYQELTEQERAYIAGIIDGEGSVRWHNHHTKYTKTKRYTYTLPTVSITNTNEVLMSWLHSKLGGSLFTVNHSNPAWSQCWQLNFRGSLQIQDLLEVIKPYLIVKASIAEEILQWGRERA